MKRAISISLIISSVLLLVRVTSAVELYVEPDRPFEPITLGSEIYLYGTNTPPGNDLSNVDGESHALDGRYLKGVVTPRLYAFDSDLTGKRPAVIHITGGSYGMLALHTMAKEKIWLHAMGVRVFYLIYRLPSGGHQSEHWYAPLTDVQSSIKYIRDNADLYGVDTNRIGVMGFSAGGHLAGSAATMHESPSPYLPAVTSAEVRPDFAMMFYPVVTMSQLGTHPDSQQNLTGNEASNTDGPIEIREQFSLENRVTSNTVTTFIAHGAIDTGVKPINSEYYFDAMVSNAAPVEYVTVESGEHNFWPEVDGCLVKAKIWLYNVLQTEGPEMEVFCKGAITTSGNTNASLAAGTDFGDVLFDGRSVTHTFTIANRGTESFSLTGSPAVVLTGDTSDFTIVTNASSTNFAPGSSATYEVRFQPTLVGERSAQISIASTDTNANPYVFIHITPLQGRFRETPTKNGN